ncbi:30S ribosomal protein S12 methylthiotransferase RimO [Gloeomargarita sp.]
MTLAAARPKVAFAHLGCEKNRIDTEHMLGLLAAAGYQIGSDPTQADYVIVNTCSFIEAARRESVQTLVELAEADKKIVITGCLAQQFREELLAAIPEAVAVVGTGDYQHIVQVLHQVEQGEKVLRVTAQPTYLADETVPRYRTTCAPVAYVRVAEGCDYRCSFCIIPHLRGNQRSRTIESIVAEAQELADQGVQELILISQITTNYGLDVYGKPRLADLLYALGDVPIPWIRVHYSYPTGLTPEVLRAFRDVPNVLPYIDLPLQHSHPEILRAMNRPWQQDLHDRLLERIRELLPDAVIRTTFIVGFPGETAAHFRHLCAFVERHQFDHVGVFTFSAEAGTPAATLPGQVSEAVKRRRQKQLMQKQQPISWAKHQQYVGRVVDVLIEQEHPQTGRKIGRSARFSPEVDGQVYVSGPAALGTIVPVKITQADVYDLYGEVVVSPAINRPGAESPAQRRC